MTRKMIIDTDTASDDAVALVMALRHPDIEVAAITIVAGNVTTESGEHQCPLYRRAVRERRSRLRGCDETADARTSRVPLSFTARTVWVI